ncbi:hypothetical protein ILUMI_12250 [Ignelater luminosus]|uniref:Uncharacterized protein n=1 Tax=Ignelater luminosus TaxID=2038154 RepID=A0A8K0G6Y6_IGNLU|nr:hypothetical protein ILUMI_12250 [Ignelater luminosus]
MLKVGRGVNSLERKRIFAVEMKQQTVQHCKALDARLTLKSFPFLAYNLAERNGFNNATQLAGIYWTREFMERHHLSLRTPKKTLTEYFKNFKEVLVKYEFSPHRIYNMDKSDFQTVSNKLPKHTALKSEKEVPKNVSTKHSKTFIVACCINASGRYVPPFFIFSRKPKNELLIRDGTIACVLEATNFGYMNKEDFLPSSVTELEERTDTADLNDRDLYTLAVFGNEPKDVTQQDQEPPPEQALFTPSTDGAPSLKEMKLNVNKTITMIIAKHRRDH